MTVRADEKRQPDRGLPCERVGALFSDERGR
jgi:hypothetical protein